MLICWLEPPSAKVQGDQVYRTRQPCLDLAQAPGTYTVCGPWLHPALRAAALTADVLVCAQSVDTDLLAVFAERRRRNLVSVFEVNDNFLEPRAFGDVGSFYHHPDQRTLALALVRQADALQTSSPYLAQLFGPRAQRCAVFANAVDALPAVCPAPCAASKAGLRIGWGGSAGHDKDLQAAMPAFAQILAAVPNSTLAIMAPASLRPLFAWVPKGRLDYRLDGSLAAYQDFVATLHVGVAPLCDTAFNRGRSDVKFLEYASAGVCAVLQRAPAYAAVNALGVAESFADPTELAAAVVRLAQDPALRERRRRAAHAYLLAHRTRAKMAASRRAFFDELTAQRDVPTSPPHRRLEEAFVAGTGEAIEKAAGLSWQGRSIQVGFDVASAHLFNGLLEQQAGRCGEADFRRAVARRPHDYLGHLYLGHHARQPGAGHAALERAHALAPHSPAVACALAQKALELGRHDRVLTLWDSYDKTTPIPAQLALCVHKASVLAHAPQPLAPLWLGLANATDHPNMAQALGAAILRDQGPPTPLLLAAACGALRRAAQSYPQMGQLPLLLAQLLRFVGAWEACWRALHPLCSDAGEATRGWDPTLVGGVYALGAEAARRTGRLASARRLAHKARAQRQAVQL